MYSIVYGFLYIISLLPWRVLYIISDFGYAIIYYMLRYRRDVVMHNLSIAFPDKTVEERAAIAKQFYKNFADSFIETIKLLSISEKELNRRFVCDYSVVNDLYDSVENIHFVASHFFSWEVANLAYSANLKYDTIGVYMPISNKIFNKIFFKMRTRFNNTMISATNFSKEFMPLSKERYGLMLGADQNPGNPLSAWWVDFFGRKTPFVKGPEKGAKVNRSAVVLMDYYRVKRGYYKGELKVMTLEPRNMAEGEITKGYVSHLEQQIRKHPDCYLWSHKRWKHVFDEEKYGGLVI